jgi:hypothetical protein
MSVLWRSRVHHPQTLHRVRASLRDEPSRRAAIVPRVLQGADDYAAYLVALELGCQMVDVKILAETAS